MISRREFIKLAMVSASAMSLGMQVGCNGGDDRLEFAIIGDPHLYDSGLGTTGAAFQAYTVPNPKLVREIEAIVKSCVDSIIRSNAQFVLVAGDMTKDGERDCHDLMASYLAQIKAAGKPVYVVPGNHDILNPRACSYSGNTTTPVANVTAAEFAAIYEDYGYGSAIIRDPNSLSYVAEPADGYWLLAMDSCIYNSTTTTLIDEGALSGAPLAWIRARLAEARQKGKTVLGLMHHLITEHFDGQADLFPGFVIDNWQTVSKTLAQDGLRFVFTGHFHATDITQRSWTDLGARTLYDIGTGSLASYPCPYRYVSIEDDVMSISTAKVTSIDYDTGGESFQQYAMDYALPRLTILYTGMLMSPPYSLTLTDAQQYAPLIANAMMAHYVGDETPDNSVKAAYQALLASSDPSLVLVGQFISPLWSDLEPTDNSLTVSVYA